MDFGAHTTHTRGDGERNLCPMRHVQSDFVSKHLMVFSMDILVLDDDVVDGLTEDEGSDDDE